MENQTLTVPTLDTLAVEQVQVTSSKGVSLKQTGFVSGLTSVDTVMTANGLALRNNNGEYLFFAYKSSESGACQSEFTPLAQNPLEALKKALGSDYKAHSNYDPDYGNSYTLYRTSQLPATATVILTDEQKAALGL